jgi:hypothetical protein
MENIHVVSIPEFPALSNGALVLAVSLICIMYRKMEETLHGNCACTQPPFSAPRTQHAGKQSPPFERA